MHLIDRIRYSKLNKEIKEQMEKPGLDPKTVESKITELIQVQREAVKELIKTNSQVAAKKEVSND